jgi:hypothetical protein
VQVQVLFDHRYARVQVRHITTVRRQYIRLQATQDSNYVPTANLYVW